MTEDHVFYRRWIIANGWAESAGLGTTFALGRLLEPRLQTMTSTLAILGRALAAIVLGTLLEGVLVGFAQENVLRARLTLIRRRSWVAATAVGAGLAWVLGMVPSTVMALTTPETANGTAPEPGALVQYGLAVVLGCVAGPILGLAQWSVLRRVVGRAAHWLWANVVAWAVGMPVVFFGMDRVPWDGHPAAMFVAIYVVCAAAGLVVGAIHGQVLVRLVNEHGST